MASFGSWTKLLAASMLTTAVIGMNANAADTLRTTRSINVRKGPSTAYSVVTTLNKGDTVTRIGSSDHWIEIETGSYQGYVSENALVKTASSYTRYCTASSLRVRSKPSTSAKVIGSLSRGQSCQVVSASNGWSRIKYGGSYGYVSSDYLSKNKPSSSSSSSSGKTRYCTASALNVRSKPSTSAKKIGSLSRGQSCTVTSTSNGWSRIKYKGSNGYVSSEYLSKNKPSSGGNGNSSNSNRGERIASKAKGLLGCQYEYGATGPRKFDCSGFTQYVYRQCGVSIPRTSSSQFNSRNSVSKSNLRVGDLVFYDTNNSGGVSHVGIYLGSGRMIHAANSKDDVCIDSINSTYYSKRYKGAGRY